MLLSSKHIDKNFTAALSNARLTLVTTVLISAHMGAADG